MEPCAVCNKGVFKRELVFGEGFLHMEPCTVCNKEVFKRGLVFGDGFLHMDLMEPCAVCNNGVFKRGLVFGEGFLHMKPCAVYNKGVFKRGGLVFGEGSCSWIRPCDELTAAVQDTGYFIISFLRNCSLPPHR